MSRHTKLRYYLALLCALPCMALADTAPSSTQPPYLVPLVSGVEFTAILTAGDSAPSGTDMQTRYRMVGTPDGLGAYDNGDGTFTLLMNHELGANKGAVRAHGSKGAFVSRWQIRKSDLAVLSGQDLIRTIHNQNGTAPTAMRYLCSADLAPVTAYYNHKTGKGWHAGRLFLNGEETADGRAFAHIASGAQQGQSHVLGAFGKAAFENLLAHPFEQDKTIVIATDDRQGGKVMVYVGNKQAWGNPVERAGLTNGKTTPIRLGDVLPGRFSLADNNGTPFARPEDGVWDTLDTLRFYFVTTDKFDGNPRLWELRFDDIRQPEHGGTVRVLLEGAQHGIKMPDNLTVDEAGNIYIQEDPGDNPHLGALWRYQPKTGKLDKLAQANPEFFSKNGAHFLTENEESSGIIDVTSLFDDISGYNTRLHRYFLLDVQAHHPISGDMRSEVVQGGQLLLMKVPR